MVQLDADDRRWAQDFGAQWGASWSEPSAPAQRISRAFSNDAQDPLNARAIGYGKSQFAASDRDLSEDEAATLLPYLRALSVVALEEMQRALWWRRSELEQGRADPGVEYLTYRYDGQIRALVMKYGPKGGTVTVRPEYTASGVGRRDHRAAMPNHEPPVPLGSEVTGRAPLTSKSTGHASPLRRRKWRVRIIVASVFAACFAFGSAGLVSTASHADEGSVVRVIDGDTVDIRIGDKVERVRLLNVDAPEDNRVSGESECLGPQATAMLTRLLPEGTRITLEYDKERRDRYDRLLAGILSSDGDLVNAKMAEAGLAGPLVVGGNDRFNAKVMQAFEAARSSQVGAFDKNVECTPGAIVESYRQQTIEAVTQSQPTGAADLAVVAASSSALGAAGDVALAKIESSGWMGDALAARSIHNIETMQGQLADFGVVIGTAHKQAVAEEARIIEERRIAEEKAAREQAAREQAAREQAARESAERARTESHSNTNGAAPKQANPPKSNDGGGSTYTGCRNYNGTGMIDTKGRPFAPIPCP